MAKHRCYHKQWSQFVTHKYVSNKDDLICFSRALLFILAPVQYTLKIMTRKMGMKISKALKVMATATIRAAKN